MSHASAPARLADHGAARLHQLAGRAIRQLDRIVARLDQAAARLAAASELPSGNPVDRAHASGNPLTAHLARPTGRDQATPSASGSVDTRPPSPETRSGASSTEQGHTHSLTPPPSCQQSRPSPLHNAGRKGGPATE